MRLVFFLVFLFVTGLGFNQGVVYLTSEEEVAGIFDAAESEILLSLPVLQNKLYADSLLAASRRGVEVFLLIHIDKVYLGSSFAPSLSFVNGVEVAAIKDTPPTFAVVDRKYIVEGVLLQRAISVIDDSVTVVRNPENESLLEKREQFLGLWDNSQAFTADINTLIILGMQQQ